MRALHLAILLMLPALPAAAVSPAGAQEREWVTVESDAGVEMMYGTPESDDIMFAVRCDAKSKDIFIGFAHEPIGVRSGSAIDLTLFSEAGETVVPSKASYLDTMDIWLIETTPIDAEKLRPIVIDGTVLSVMVQDGSEEIPLAGTADDFKSLFKACAK